MDLWTLLGARWKAPERMFSASPRRAAFSSSLLSSSSASSLKKRVEETPKGSIRDDSCRERREDKMEGSKMGSDSGHLKKKESKNASNDDGARTCEAPRNGRRSFFSSPGGRGCRCRRTKRLWLARSGGGRGDRKHHGLRSSSMTVLYTRFKKMCSLDCVSSRRMMVPLLGDLSRLWKSEGGGVSLSLSHWCSKGRATTRSSVVDQKKIQKRTTTTRRRNKARFFCVEMICVVVSKKKECVLWHLLISVESIEEAHKAREREREKKKPHKKRNKIVSKKRDFSHMIWGLGYC